MDSIRLEYISKEVDTCYNEYEPTKAGRLISDFVNDNLSNWYVRLNRKRFWGGGFTQDKLSAYQTLYTMFGDCSQTDGTYRSILCRPLVQ